MKRTRHFDLPPRMRRGGNSFYYDLGGKPRHWVPLGSDPLIAMRKYNLMEIERNRPPREMTLQSKRVLRARYGFENTDPIKHMKGLYRRAISTSKTRGIRCDLRERDVIYLYHESKGFCSVTGIPFSFEYDKRWSRRPWVPSLDRMNPRGGYIFSNLRLVCAAVNVCISDWGDEVFAKIASAFLSKNPSTPERNLSAGT